MSEASAFIGLLQSINSAQNILSSLLGLRVSAEVSGKIAEANKHLIEMSERLMAAQAENAALITRIRQLEEVAVQAKRSESALEDYEMKQVGQGAFVYAVKEGHNICEPPHWLCPDCFSNGHKSILQHDILFSIKSECYLCPRCKTGVQAEKGRTPGINDQTP